MSHAEDFPKNGFNPTDVLCDLLTIRSAESNGLGLAREIRTDREIESLIAWANERGALWQQKIAPKKDELTGGEHLVEIDEVSERIFKATHPGKFGFSADIEMIHLVLDALPRNVLTLKNHRLMPFDVVVVKPSSHLKAKLNL